VREDQINLKKVDEDRREEKKMLKKLYFPNELKVEKLFHKNL